MGYRQFVKRLFPYLKNHLGKLAFTSIMMVFATLLETAIPEITGQIVDTLFSSNRSSNAAFSYSVILFSVIALSSLFALISISASSWISNKVIMDLRVNMFTKLLRLPKSYFDKNTTGETLSKLTFDVEQISAAASTIWLEFIKSSFTVIILTGYLFYKSFLLSLSLLVLLPLVYLAVKFSTSRIRKGSARVQESMGKMTHLLDENISGNDLIKIYQAQNSESNKFFNIINTIRQQRFKVDMAGGLNTSIVNVLIGLSLACVVYFSSTFLTMSAGDFLAYFTAMGMLVKPAKTLININKPLQQAIVAGKSVFRLIDEDPESNQNTKSIDSISGDICFNNVSFSYDNIKSSLNNINLTIKKGETIALVGSTGSGKTTIVNLLTRFYNPTSGNILINDEDIISFELKSYRSNFSYVDQNVRLFNDTISGNIAFGQKETMPMDLIIDAAKVSNAIEFIEKLDNKFDSNIGEDGVTLSGGQRQRLSIARAIAKDSPILILDEATSALDSATEKLVQSAIDKMQKDRTTIIIAHRLSTIQNADRIIVLKDGEIIEQGTHSELIKASGEYSKLIQQQT
ncbi:MAG: ATP-binding cassette domain-containing protein [Thiotrichales bacterium]|jgi:subfamily B ATP-binding cassette protein MsbA|nr:ATP-binding cassette domain-containing protein [Thiotrichales bacterium]MBT5499651.1 ATP-binding cassette domain-containing protein [Thiotrichales bacterium]MBT7149273.1 ATP-binding cassette domain-containing protein [Thiotrichales bacterium]MBT7933939.1 ATP-binding cassette domain-containing protein [Thiotrichales bacterium]